MAQGGVGFKGFGFMRLNRRWRDRVVGEEKVVFRYDGVHADFMLGMVTSLVTVRDA